MKLKQFFTVFDGSGCVEFKFEDFISIIFTFKIIQFLKQHIQL